MNGQSKSDVCMYVYVYTNTYTMDCYSAFINKGILPFVTTWKDSDGITQSEISQTLKDKHNMILLICVSKKKKPVTDKEDRLAFAGGEGEGWVTWMKVV